MMFKILKYFITFLIVLNLAACSYSPNALKEAYRELATELADEIKEPMDLSPTQNALVEEYAKSLMQWHRQNKLPEYSQKMAGLSRFLSQKDFSVSSLQAFIDYFDEVPHFDQAAHLSSNMARLAKSLTDQQVIQLEKSLESELQQASLEAANTSLAKEYSDGIYSILRFIGLQLNSKQRQIVSNESKKLHNLRFEEIKAETIWNKQLIALLNNRKSLAFQTKFSRHWTKQNIDLSGQSYKLEQENKRITATMIKKMILSLDQFQRNKLSQQLLSMSHAFSELANE